LVPGKEEKGVSKRTFFAARLYPPLLKPPDAEQATQLEILRRRVKEYWVDGVLKHSLHNEVLISLGKREIGDAVDAPWKYTVQMSDAVDSPPLDDRGVNTIYDATGLLLILGEPGSGMSTTLLDLARSLLDRAEKTAGLFATAQYLDKGGPKLAPLSEAVKSDPVLQELAETPLMLSIMSLACQGASGNALVRQKRASLEERRKQVFRLYVEQMFQRKGTASNTFSKEKVIGWLSWLARRMREHSQSVFLVESFNRVG
jgi:hypothetical protein